MKHETTMSYSFKAKDKQGNMFVIGISKTSTDTTIIKVNQDSFNTLKLKRNARGTRVKGKCSFFFKKIDITLQINCNPQQPTFSITSKPYSNTFDFFALAECIGLHFFIKSQIPT